MVDEPNLNTPPAADPKAAPAAPAAGTAPDPAKPQTALHSDPKNDKPAAAPADWPEDWRDRLAGEDTTLRKQLDRYATPGDYAKKVRSLEKMVSSGQLKQAAPGKDAKPEDLAAWRKDAGIPDTAAGYLQDWKPDGFVIGDADKPRLTAFAEEMHKVHARPEQVQAAIGSYYKMIDAEKAEIAKKDDAARMATEDALRQEWGNEYRPTINVLHNFLDTLPGDGTKDLLLSARLANGTPIFSHPDIVKWFAAKAREINPIGTIVPGSGGNQAQGVDEEIAKIEKVMREDRKAYNADDKMQTRYRELLEARLKLAERSGKAA